jgi:phosphoglycerate kinase
MKTLNDFDFKNKKAIIRVDFNVPLDEILRLLMPPYRGCKTYN